MVPRIAFTAAAAVLVVAAAGCGGGGSPAATRAAQPAVSKGCASHPAAVKRALGKVNRDIAEIRRAADTVPASQSQKGNPAVNKATDRFLVDVSKAPITNVRRNRLIDFAASALVGSCELCFSALEAQRPIVSIKFPSRGACG